MKRYIWTKAYNNFFLLVLQTKTKEKNLIRTNQFVLGFYFGGRGWIRTTESGAGRFTVCSLWPLGNPSSNQACARGAFLRLGLAAFCGKSRIMPGAGDGSWTRNLLITNQLLCHWATPAVNLVPRGGIEPPTRRFSVSCSTDWAIEAKCGDLEGSRTLDL